MNLRNFYNQKAQWVKKVKLFTLEVDDLAKSFRAGRHIGMGRLYELGYKTQKLGVRGEQLREAMDQVRPPIARRERVHQGIAAVCQLLEVASKVLVHVLEVQNTPQVSFPSYETDLYQTAAVDTAPLENFEELRRRIEGEVD